MPKDPALLSNDENRCPHCKAELTEGKSPFYIKEKKIGSFDSLLCKPCGFSIFTDTGTIELTKKLAQTAFDDD